jgi:hypothetical protein
LTLSSALMKSRLAGLGVSTRKQVGDAESMINEEGIGAGRPRQEDSEEM